MRSFLSILASIFVFLFVLYAFAIFMIHRPIDRWDWQDINLEQALSIPDDFIWGVASAAYQVEGHHDETDNWGWWETQTDKDGKDRVRGFAGIGNDEWNLYLDDIKNMRYLGLDSYRFSLSWSKIQPKENTFSETALAHY